MNQIQEDMTSDNEAAGDAPALQNRGSDFTRPAYSFKGVELWPYTYGYELLFNQVRDPEDTGLFTWLAFVFLLRKREVERQPGRFSDETISEHRNWAINLAWRVNEFRAALTDWMDANGPFTPEDKLEAKRIYEENMKAIAESAVEPVPGKGGRSVQKKTRPKKAA